MELDPPMKQFGSMAVFSSYRSASNIATRRRSGALHVVAAMVGLPILLCCFVTSSDAAPVQARSNVCSDVPVDCLKDLDGDGLDDALECGQYSSPEHVDTDGDGWNDAEELARGSLANVTCSQPLEEQVSVGARAYMRANKLHLAIASYMRNGSMAHVEFGVGILACKQLIPLSPLSYAQSATLTTVPTKVAGELLLVTDIVVPNTPLLRSGSMSIYVTMRVGEFLRAATAINLEMHGNTPMELIDPGQVAPAAYEQLGPGLLHRPLGGTHPPISWSSGEICFQHIEAVGTHGAVVTQEVTSATCVSGWDGYCDASSCTSSVGTTVDVVDPGALIGG